MSVKHLVKAFDTTKEFMKKGGVWPMKKNKTWVLCPTCKNNMQFTPEVPVPTYEEINTGSISPHIHKKHTYYKTIVKSECNCCRDTIQLHLTVAGFNEQIKG